MTETNLPQTEAERGRWVLPVSLIAITLIICGAPIICVSTGVGGIFQPFQSLFQNIGTIFNPPTTARVSNTQTLMNGIQPLGQLVSMSLQVAKADIEVNVTSGIGNTCGFSANHVAQGTVEAGIDLTRITENDIKYDEKTNTYRLTLPTAQLTSCRVDWIRQYDRSTTACNVDWDEARIIANYSAMNGFHNDALGGGVLTRAQQQADLIISQFVRSLTGANVVITFRGENAALPSSCQPQPPAGWEYHAEHDQWKKN
jgi:hypothetical protein